MLSTHKMIRLSLFMLCLFSLQYDVNPLSTDGMTLLSLLRHWTMVPASINSSWKNASDSDSTPCSWVGIQCDNAFNVITINLTGYSLSGSLGPEIAHLTHLQTIDLSSNTLLSGTIPSVLGNCSFLEHLDLSANSFIGQIPYSLGNLKNLRFFNVQQNMLTGEIPDSMFQIPYLENLILSDNYLLGSIPLNIGNATDLLRLHLFDNQLSGMIPFSIGNCSKLMKLFLNNNNFHGVLPESFDRLTSLVSLGLSNNSLEGEIPLVSGRCKSLYDVDLSNNKFSGGLPSSLGNCSSLTDFLALNANLVGSIPSSLGLLSELSMLMLSMNKLSGKIPSEIGNCKSLKQLNLDENHLEGEIPSELGMLSQLEELRLFSNNLSGEIPLSIWKIPNLVLVILNYNNLSGELPIELANLKHLKKISLFSNQFSGVIPQNLGINSSLVHLDLTDNHFTGNIPPNICLGNRLENLTLGSNKLQGHIPSNIGRCTSLRRLLLDKNNLSGTLPYFTSNSSLIFMNISENNISGAIPSSLGNCTNLNDVDLSHNNFIGYIPLELGSLVNLQRLILSQNKLEGPLPSQLSNCSMMEHFDVGFNSLNGSFPSSLRNWTGLTTLILRENHFSGGIPSFLSEFIHVSELQLGGNYFGGKISSSIGKFQQLNYVLNLSANKLTGEIPPEIGNLIYLQILDLSLNNLSGNIEALGNLPSLIAINVSHNSFFGPLPDTLLNILHSSPSSFLANPGLCVTCTRSNTLNCSTSNSLKPCENIANRSKHLSKIKVGMIALGSTLLVIFLLYGLVYVLHSNNKKDIKIFPEQKSSFLKKVMQATENLNDRHIIGKGAHGVIYKVEYSPKDVFAIKKIVFEDNKGKIKIMRREIETMGGIKHRNLVRIKNFWLGKDYGLIQYKYMQNGSLHDVLHEKYPPVSLEWRIRYKIAVGIAYGLEYLHHDCNPVIVHRDIKPKNILLDADMEPCITDFGIATLLEHSSNSMQSFLVPGTVGYIAPVTPTLSIEDVSGVRQNVHTTVMSSKSDVYSYGVVLLELITRKKVLDDLSFMDETHIVGWVKSMWEETRDISSIVDSSLVNELLDINLKEQVEQVFLVALRCTEKHPDERPTMRDIVKQLIIKCKAPNMNNHLKVST